MAAEHTSGTSRTASKGRSVVRRRRRKLPNAPDPVAPVWWPEYVELHLAKRRAEKVVEEATRRIDLATWYIVTHKGVRAAWLAQRLGVSGQRVWNRVATGRRHVERGRMTPEAVAAMLFTPLERAERARKRKARRARDVAASTAWWSAPGPEGRPLPPTEVRDTHFAGALAKEPLT